MFHNGFFVINKYVFDATVNDFNVTHGTVSEIHKFGPKCAICQKPNGMIIRFEVLDGAISVFICW
jgi:hypothetical protein